MGGKITTLNMDEENEGRTFGFSGVYNPKDKCACYSTRNIPHKIAMDVGRELYEATNKGIREGLEEIKEYLGDWKSENLCFAYSIMLFDKSEIEGYGEAEIVLNDRIHYLRGKNE
jgi:hypothetical protein